jgi:hypothetical protein
LGAESRWLVVRANSVLLRRVVGVAAGRSVVVDEDRGGPTWTVEEAKAEAKDWKSNCACVEGTTRDQMRMLAAGRKCSFERLAIRRGAAAAEAIVDFVALHDGQVGVGKGEAASSIRKMVG